MNRQLFKAIRSGKVQAVRVALAAGADPNAQQVEHAAGEPGIDDSGPVLTALSATLTNGHVDVARVLIDAGADLNLPDGDGCRPLDVAILYAGRAAVRLLIERGAEVNYIRQDGDTALMAAAGVGSAAMVEMFLAAGADPNITRQVDGLTVADIQVCCINSLDVPAGMRTSSKRILEVLRKAGAKVHTMEEIEATTDARWRVERRKVRNRRHPTSKP